MKKTTGFLLFCAGVIALIAMIGEPIPAAKQSPAKQSPAKPAKTAEQVAAEKAKDAEFQKYVLAVGVIKRAMKNPASFQLDEALVTKPGTLCLVYRATNSFNALVPANAVITGDKIATSDHGGEFAAMWKKHCAGKPGEDWSYIRRALR